MGTAQGIALWVVFAIGLTIGWATGVGRGRQLKDRENARKLQARIERNGTGR